MNPVASTLCKLRFFPANSKFFCTLSIDSRAARQIVRDRKTVLLRGISTEIRAKARFSDAELKERWLDSLSYPFYENGRLPIEGIEQIDGVSSSEWIIGIDPDVTGAMALLKDDASGCTAQVFDNPCLQVLVGRRTRRRLHARSIVQLLHGLGVPHGTKAYIEKSTPYPQDGKQGWWGGGFTYGLWVGVLVASGFSVVPIASRFWKDQFQLCGSSCSKDDSRKIASSLFPSTCPLLKRKKDHGRAEALLIAACGKGLKLKPDGGNLSDNASMGS